jgi:5-methylcytosine-specific restriction enzyme A
MKYPCLDCHQLTNTTRCPDCERIRQRNRNRRRLQYLGTWAATSRRARKAQPWCTRCGTTTDLTLDHETGTVECRSCNASHRRNVT